MKRVIFLHLLAIPLTICAEQEGYIINDACMENEGECFFLQEESERFDCEVPVIINEDAYIPVADYEVNVCADYMPCIELCEPAAACGCFFAFGDFLYWQAKEEGLDYITSAPAQSPEPPFAPDSFPTSLDKNSNFAPGFRLALGFERNWDSVIYWTHYQCKNKNGLAVTAENSPLVPLLFNTASGPAITSLTGGSAAGIWKVKFDVLDWELGYLLPYACLNFRPHIGLRAAWIKQTINVNYNNVTFFVDSPTNPANYTSFNDNKFRGLGLRVGGDGNWNFWRSCSLFATSGFSLLSGHFDVFRREVLESTVTYPATTGVTFSPGTERARTDVTRHQVSSAIDLTAGLGYMRNFCCMQLALSIAWEAQIWFAQNQMLEIVENAQNFRYQNLRGDLSMQGLTVRAAVAY